MLRLCQPNSRTLFKDIFVWFDYSLRLIYQLEVIQIFKYWPPDYYTVVVQQAAKTQIHTKQTAKSYKSPWLCVLVSGNAFELFCIRIISKFSVECRWWKWSRLGWWSSQIWDCQEVDFLNPSSLLTLASFHLLIVSMMYNGMIQLWFQLSQYLEQFHRYQSDFVENYPSPPN